MTLLPTRLPIRSRAMVLVLVVALAVALLVWMRVRSPRHSGKPIVDRSATSPLNRPGGGAAPDEAYKVYSALYQSTDEPLVFSEDSVTDIPQVDGSCLRPSTQEEHELTDAFVLRIGRAGGGRRGSRFRLDIS
jgi:hypothetical protein